MNIGKISFIISIVSLLLMLVTFNLNPIIISGVLGLPGVHVFILFVIFIISLLISILTITVRAFSNKMKKHPNNKT